MPVFDALNARGDRALDGGGRIGVHGDVSVAIGGRLHAGAKLGLAEGQHVQRGARRRHASAPHQLDLRRALQKLLAHPQAHFVGAVGDIGGAGPFHGAHWTARAPRQIGQGTHVPVAAGRRDHGAARIDARSRHESFVDRLFERKRRTAEIPNRGEAAHQRALRLGAGGEEDIADVRREQSWDRQRGEHAVPVRVDQSRHHDPAAAIDRARPFRTCRAPGRDRLDPPAFDDERK